MRFLLPIAVVAAWLACNAPTIPLPPPSPDGIVLTSVDGRRLEFAGDAGSVPPRSYVYVYDDDSERGAIVRAGEEGVWRADPILGAVGDTVWIWYRDETDAVSGVLCLRAVAGRQSDANLCDTPANTTPDGG